LSEVLLNDGNFKNKGSNQMGVKNSPQGIYFVKVHRKNEAIAKKGLQQ
jgi:hypothetical protein